ncbi:IS66 family insertion sequence element accessory protein TnpB, partial [Escherichia coli]|nr:IS66 family insertion sequence element accessory protein TnpB [Escherichia coli]EFC4360043.1 IS66 family insertion sequence element accessory protein TnpB [Escherichia coli]EFF9634507.1 IS66 family insertion sequence element accessory protein TnpB [Escherichia coli]
MISLPAGSRIWLVAGITDMRNGFNGLASKVQNVLKDDPFSGHLFIFRGRRGDQIKVLWADSDGLCLFTKRLERGRFVWPVTRNIHVNTASYTILVAGREKNTGEEWDVLEFSSLTELKKYRKSHPEKMAFSYSYALSRGVDTQFRHINIAEADHF